MKQLCPRSLENLLSGRTRISTGLSASTALCINYPTNVQGHRLSASLVSQCPVLRAIPGFLLVSFFVCFAVLDLSAQSSSSNAEVAQDSTMTTSCLNLFEPPQSSPSEGFRCTSSGKRSDSTAWKTGASSCPRRRLATESPSGPKPEVRHTRLASWLPLRAPGAVICFLGGPESHI